MLVIFFSSFNFLRKFNFAIILCNYLCKMILFFFVNDVHITIGVFKQITCLVFSVLKRERERKEKNWESEENNYKDKRRHFWNGEYIQTKKHSINALVIFKK